jgi:hypothetical protein
MITLPAYLVKPRILQVFARGADVELSPRDLLVLLCLSLASPNERVALRGLMLLTGLCREEVAGAIGALKSSGLIDQLGDIYTLTGRGKEALNHVEKEG